jgi:hypothetical protein
LQRHLRHATHANARTCCRFSHNGETEYLPLDPWLKKKGISHETTVRYTPRQNGVTERDNRTLVEGARTLLYSNKALPLQLWAEAVNCVVSTPNRTVTSAYSLMTPIEAWYGFKPDVSNLRVFGSKFYGLIPHQLRCKLDAKGLLCFFVRNSDIQKGDRYRPLAMSKSAKTSLPLVTTMMPRLSRPNFQKGVDVFPTTVATPAGSPTDPATTTLFDPVTEILSTLLNRD